MIYFFVVVLLFPPLSSLLVEVLFAELADVMSVLPPVLLSFAPEVDTFGEAAEDPEPEAPEEVLPEPVVEAVVPLPPLDEVLVTSVVWELWVFQYSSSFCSTSPAFL